jgi:hypothetical protein
MPKGKIKTPEVKPNQRKVRFSFECLQIDHPRFPIAECTREYYEALLREILRYQQYTVDQFSDIPNPNPERRHPIYFVDTEEKDGFPGIDPSMEDLWTDDPWQFALPGERGTPSFGWRVHGFISENVFHIVWLDPCHKLDSPDPRFHEPNDSLHGG